MSLTEKFVYGVVSFLFVYVVLSLGLRLFELTSTKNAHMIGGIIGLFIGMGLFMWLLIKKK